MKKFKLGFIVGRFQFVHKGHEQLINLGLDLCEKFVVVLGSSNESRTERCPFTFDERKEMLEKIYGKDRLIIVPIFDIGIGYVPEWGKYVMNTIKFYCGEYPDFCIRGIEENRSNWINKDVFDLNEMIISRNMIKISATNVRRYLSLLEFTDDDKEHIIGPQSKINYSDFISDRYTIEDKKKYSKILNSIKTEKK